MESTVNVFAELAKQGPLITALMVAIVYFYKRQTGAEKAAKEQADKIEDLLKEDRKEMLKVIENNTHVMEENIKALKRIYQLNKQD